MVFRMGSSWIAAIICSREVHWFLLILAAATLGLFIAVGIEVSLGSRRVAHLKDIPPIDDRQAPRVSVVVPACNEERSIERALSSVLSQDYPDYEVIAIDDRSTDSTGAILDVLASRNPRLRVLHIHRLPPDWLGKNWALHTGASNASGAVLLFTDADVVLEKTVLRRAVRYLLEHRIDHLAVPPRATVPGFLPNAFLGLFALLFGMYAKPWKVHDPKAREHIGIGAFNMVRTEAYRAVGGHSPIAMRPDDDMKLGKLLKMRGCSQHCVFGIELLSVEWYSSFSEMRRGLMKNLFAGIEYSVLAVVFSAIGQLVLFVWPFVAVIVCAGIVRYLNLAAILCLIAAFTVNSRLVRIKWWWCFTVPIAALVMIYLQFRSMILTFRNQGIEWRGTHYPLSRLRANRL